MKGKLKYIIIALVLLVGIFGVSYAFYEFYDIGTNHQLIVGNIYLKLNDGTDTISLTNVFPMTAEEARARTDNQVTFTLSGLNTTTDNDIYYEVMLNEGDSIEGKSRAKAEDLVFDLIEIDETGKETMILNARSFDDLDARRVFVNTISRNVTTEINRTYKLRMWLSEDVLISDSNPNADYTTSVFANSYASVKVSVFGDFEEKDMSTAASCFAYNVILPDGYIAYDYLAELTLDTSEENVNMCMDFMLNTFSYDYSDAQDGYRSFCEGTGTNWGYTLKDYIVYDLFYDDEIQSLGVVESYEFETRYYELNTSEESVNTCKEYMLNTIYDGEDLSDAQDGYQSYCEGTGTADGYSLIGDLEDGFTSYDFFIENNILTQVEIPQGTEIEITNYHETCGTDVIIPSTIEGFPVTRIADVSNFSGAFCYKNITDVTFPNTLKYIGKYAFHGSYLTEVIIPNSVVEIGYGAFGWNDITNIEVGTGITSIEDAAFIGNQLVNVNIKSNPSLGYHSFYSACGDMVASSEVDCSNYSFESFKYVGTCEELNQYGDVFKYNVTPSTIITSDNNACEYITR